MSKNLHISVADLVYEKIEDTMRKKNATNKSEFVEELIRVGLAAEELIDEKEG